jgi:hypothetical protein
LFHELGVDMTDQNTLVRRRAQAEQQREALLDAISRPPPVAQAA